MNLLEIVLIIIGIVVVIISCRLVDKTPNSAIQTSGKTFSMESSITDEDKEQLKDRIDKLLSEVSEEVIIRTDDSLSKLSNEKIMAVNEFSDQILEKINRNHEEVVFLYNMLNDKEKELKATVKEIDSSKKKVQDIIENKVDTHSSQAVKETKPQAPIKEALQASHNDMNGKTTENKADIVMDIPTLDSIGDNSNSQILSLYSQGKSVMEISKLLGLGQGEVKLVIELFKGKK